MTKLKSYTLPIVAGVMLGTMLQVMGEKGIHSLYPLPDGLRMDDRQGLAAYMSSLPSAALLLLLGNYIVCTIIAGLLATLIAGQAKLPAIIAGSIIALGAVFSAVMLSFEPLWFSIFSILVLVPAALIGYTIAILLRPGKPDKATL